MSLAVISWTCALVAIAVYYFRVNNWPNNLIPTMLTWTLPPSAWRPSRWSAASDNRLGSINLTALGSYRATIWTAGGALELTSNVL